MADSSAELHESEEKLSAKTLDRHRAIVSLMEELEAIDWYQQGIDATDDESLASILAHNRDEEMEHAAMTLEWLRRDFPALSENFKAYPGMVAEATDELRGRGVDGPYAIALDPDLYTGLAKTTHSGGFPVLEHLDDLLDGPVVWAPSLEGAVVLSLRDGDFELTFGGDLSIGYLDHNAREVRFFIEESFTFRVLGPEAAVALGRGED